MSAQAEPFDFRWLTAIVSRAPLASSSNVWARTGRLRVSMKRGSTPVVRIWWAPTGANLAGL